MIRHTAYALALGAIFSTAAMGQKADTQSLTGLPEACGAAPKSSMGMPPEPPMDDMTETQKALHMAMMKMDPATMKGMIASDPTSLGFAP